MSQQSDLYRDLFEPGWREREQAKLDAYGRHGIPLHKHPPAVREPLSDAEIHEWWARDNGLEDVDMCKLADFTQVIRAIEAAHGIKS